MSGTPTIEARRTAVAAATSMLAGLGGSVVEVGNAELGPFFRQVDDLSRQVEAARVAILGEALSRGVVAGSDCATAAGWVIQWAPTFRAGGAGQLVKVAHATRAVRNVGLAAAVLGARVGVRNAAVALVEMDKLRPRLRDEAVEAVWAGFLQIATDHGPAEIRGLRDKLIATHGHEGEFQRRADQLKHGVSLSQPLDDDGMAEYRLRLDPEGKEVLEAMLGPLSAPKPTAACSDLRSSDQRRGDALVEICRRAAAAGGEAPVTTKAAVFVTVDFEDLKNGCGAGTTLGGQLLAPETIRRIACDAMVIPVVLGSDSEVLDVGRAKRLFTPGMLRAMWLRDRGCTIPGCTAPPAWADAHHLIQWVDGGVTSLLNGALLCGRHHTYVHQHGLTATVTAFGVTWQT
ncbi:MAG: HNH endonuclease signature motif containing protein [Dermatophilaceae bacterium]